MQRKDSTGLLTHASLVRQPTCLPPGFSFRRQIKNAAGMFDNSSQGKYSYKLWVCIMAQAPISAKKDQGCSAEMLCMARLLVSSCI